MPWNDVFGEGYLQTRKDWLTRPEEQKWMLQARKIMLEHLGEPFEENMIIDVGCSAGHGARTFLARPIGHRARPDDVYYWGIDSEAEYLAVGREFFRGYDSVGFHEHDISVSEGWSAYSHFVICNNVLIHLPLAHVRPALRNMLRATAQILIWRVMLGDEQIIWQSPDTGLHLNQYAFSDILPFIRDNGFDVKLVRDAYLDSVPQVVWGDQVRTYYVVVARRRD